MILDITPARQCSLDFGWLGEGEGEQDAPLAGEKGALRRVVSAATGKGLGEYKLESIPVWDGMAAANGGLYLSITNGRILCLTGQ